MIVLALLQLWLFCRQNLRSRALRPAICRQTGVMTLTQMERGPTEKGQISCPLFLIGPHWALLPPANLLGHLPQPLAISYLPGSRVQPPIARAWISLLVRYWYIPRIRVMGHLAE